MQKILRRLDCAVDSSLSYFPFNSSGIVYSLVIISCGVNQAFTLIYCLFISSGPVRGNFLLQKQ